MKNIVCQFYGSLFMEMQEKANRVKPVNWRIHSKRNPGQDLTAKSDNTGLHMFLVHTDRFATS